MSEYMARHGRGSRTRLRESWRCFPILLILLILSKKCPNIWRAMVGVREPDYANRGFPMTSDERLPSSYHHLTVSGWRVVREQDVAGRVHTSLTAQVE
jgi:hypothetical protein